MFFFLMIGNKVTLILFYNLNLLKDRFNMLILLLFCFCVRLFVCFFLLCQLNWTVLGSDTVYSFNSHVKAKWHLAVVAGCASGTNLHGLAGFIASPNFPNNYPQYNRCAWNITVPKGYIIELTFHFFQLEPHQNSPCYYDAPGARVTITNVAANNSYYPFMLCGQSLPHPVYSLGNSVQVIFTSLRKQYSGFNATYRAITYESGTNDVNPLIMQVNIPLPLCI